MNVSSTLEQGKTNLGNQFREGLIWAKETLPGPIVTIAFIASLPTLGAKTMDTILAYQQLLAAPTPIVRGIESFDVANVFPRTQDIIDHLLHSSDSQNDGNKKNENKDSGKVARPEKVATTEDLYYGHKLCLDTGPKTTDQLAASTYSCGGITIAGLGTSYDVGRFGTGVNEVINKDLYAQVMSSASHLGIKNIVVKYGGQQKPDNEGTTQQRGEAIWNSATHTLTVNMMEVGGPDGQPDGERAWGLTLASNLVLRASINAMDASDLVEVREGQISEATVNWKKHVDDIPDDLFGPFPEGGLIFGLFAQQTKLD